MFIRLKYLKRICPHSRRNSNVTKTKEKFNYHAVLWESVRFCLQPITAHASPSQRDVKEPLTNKNKAIFKFNLHTL